MRRLILAALLAASATVPPPRRRQGAIAGAAGGCAALYDQLDRRETWRYVVVDCPTAPMPIACRCRCAAGSPRTDELVTTGAEGDPRSRSHPRLHRLAATRPRTSAATATGRALEDSRSMPAQRPRRRALYQRMAAPARRRTGPRRLVAAGDNGIDLLPSGHATLTRSARRRRSTARMASTSSSPSSSGVGSRLIPCGSTRQAFLGLRQLHFAASRRAMRIVAEAARRFRTTATADGQAISPTSSCNPADAHAGAVRPCPAVRCRSPGAFLPIGLFLRRRQGRRDWSRRIDQAAGRRPVIDGRGKIARPRPVGHPSPHGATTGAYCRTSPKESPTIAARATTSTRCTSMFKRRAAGDLLAPEG